MVFFLSYAVYLLFHVSKTFREFLAYSNLVGSPVRINHNSNPYPPSPAPHIPLSILSPPATPLSLAHHDSPGLPTYTSSPRHLPQPRQFFYVSFLPSPYAPVFSQLVPLLTPSGLALPSEAQTIIISAPLLSAVLSVPASSHCHRLQTS